MGLSGATCIPIPVSLYERILMSCSNSDLYSYFSSTSVWGRLESSCPRDIKLEV